MGHPLRRSPSSRAKPPAKPPPSPGCSDDAATCGKTAWSGRIAIE